jgi:hypothetical protein
MNRAISTRSIIALLACLMVGWAFVSLPVVHKHQPAQQVPLQDYDASCCFLKAGKISSGNASQYALVSVCMLSVLLFIALQPLVGRLAQEDVPLRSIFTRKVTPPRAPPA